VKWDDVGALDELHEELNMTILQPISNPAQFEALGTQLRWTLRFACSNVLLVCQV
jgi:SpoVK/Ycf46/Vps4 family AAA+-type ATPase